jgi:uncharacterized protein YkwD
VGILAAVAAVAIGGLLLFAGPSARAQATCDHTNGSGTPAELSAGTLCLINSVRAQAGLPALTSVGDLQLAAQAHGAEMIAQGYLATRSPAGVTPSDRADSAGYTGGVLGEVLATGTGAGAYPDSVVAGWQNDATARAVLLLASARDIGVAVLRGSPSSGAGAANEATYVVYAGARPVFGKTAVVSVVSGTVLVQKPTSSGGVSHPVKLTATTVIPVGSILDATHGKVKLTTAKDRKGHTQTANFFDGRILVKQSSTGKAITTLELRGGNFSGCSTSKPGAKKAQAARKKRVRRVWGHGKGGYRLAGRNAAGTVLGTWWLTEDRCDGTLIHVKQGTVVVRDLVTHRTVKVTAGHSYFAKRR